MENNILYWTPMLPEKPGFYWYTTLIKDHEGVYCHPYVVEVYLKDDKLVYDDPCKDRWQEVLDVDQSKVRWSDKAITPPDCKTCNMEC